MSGRDYIPKAEVTGGAGVGAATPIFSTLGITPVAMDQASTAIVSGVLPSAATLSLALSGSVTLAATAIGAVNANEFFRIKVRLPKGAIPELQSSAIQASVPILAIDEVRGPVG